MGITAEELAACASEPIHLPGAVQAHGCLLVLGDDGTVLQASRNCDRHLERSSASLLGCTLDRILGPGNAQLVTRALERTNVEARPLFAGRLALAGGRFVDAVVHTHAGNALLEIESTIDGHAPDFFEMYPVVRSLTASLQQAQTVGAICEFAVEEFRRLTGFGRVLAYRFDANGHGEVLAESLGTTELPSYIGLRFPAGDIPAQARHLFRLNHVRLIPDVDYEPSPLEPALHPLTGAPVDLSFTALRSVSPVHLQYMRNMGTTASMSVSLIVRGELWGLVSCHDAHPRHVPFELRTICEHLGRVLALQIEAKEDHEETAHRLELRHQLVRMLARMAEESRGFVAGLLAHPDALLRFMQSEGAAIVENGACHRLGTTPPEAAIRRFADWLESGGKTLFHSFELQKDYPDADRLGSETGGILAVSISQLHGNYVIWFRPEVNKVVRWAGPPEPDTAEIRVGAFRLPGPRNSFREWRETLRGQSEPWRPSEVDIAGEFRTAILAIVMRRAEETAVLAAELQRSNQELEAFSYSVSHDLRAPLRHITGYADLLRDMTADRLDERGVRFLQNIGDSAIYAGLLVDNLLSFSQMGRAALKPTTVDLQGLVKRIVIELQREAPDRAIEWRVGTLPKVHADPAFLQPALRNLMANAVKYTRGREPAVIEVIGEETTSEHVLHVRDNGVGFNPKYVGKLFGIFQRLHRSEDFEGTGIGLANVKRIVERHGGRVWATGEIDRGAEFSFALPKVAVPVPQASA